MHNVLACTDVIDRVLRLQATPSAPAAIPEQCPTRTANQEGATVRTNDPGSSAHPVVLSLEPSDDCNWDAPMSNTLRRTTFNPEPYRARRNMFEMEVLDAKWTKAVAAHRALELQAGLPNPLSADTLSKSTTDLDRARFWATFDECASEAANSDCRDQAEAFLALKQRHTRKRGLTDDMIQNEVACIMQMPSFAYNLQQVVSAFSVDSHPDWQSWDMIDELCADNEADITTMSAIAIHEAVLARNATDVSMFSLETLEGMVDRMKDWRARNAAQQPFQHEASLLASLRLMEELWANYCLGYFRCNTMAEYIEALGRLPTTAEIMVSSVTLLLRSTSIAEWALFLCYLLR